MAKAKKETAYDEEREVPEQEKDAVKKLLGEIDRAKTLSKTFHEKTLPTLRKYSWGTKSGAEGDNSETTARTNLIFATMATLLPHIYAKNPEIAVAPTEAVGKDEYQNIKEFCKSAQVMLNNLFIEEGKLKRRQKSNARSAMATSVGWIKMSFQKSLAGDPLILRRANDIQDNLRRVEYLVNCAKKETDTSKLNQHKAELEQQLQSLTNSPEMKVFKGFALDRVKTEDIFILDESIVEFDDYVTAKKIAHRVWMTDEEYHETFGHDVPKGSAQYGQPAAGTVEDETGAKVQFGDGAKCNYRAVFEVWDRTSNTICCVCEGSAGYAKPPYVLKPASERWYSFFALGFNIVEGRWRPLSDVELLMRLQDEYNTTRYLFAETRKESIPTRVFRKAGNLTEDDIKSLKDRRTREWIGVEGNPTVPLNQDIMQLEGIAIDPAAFDVTIIRNDMDMMVGLSDASRANLMEAKTATEAEIMRQALMTRVAERQDTIEDLTAEMAIAALEIMLQEFNLDEVKQIVGEGAVWPEMDIERIFRKVRVSVRAGSTGKPNVLKERESWATIMPIINETITQVMELRAAGQFDLANSKIELLKETLIRYDEKIDVDRFVPKQDLDEQGQPVAQQNALAKAAQMQEEFIALQEDHKKLKEELQKSQAGEQAKVAQTEANALLARAKQSSDETLQRDEILSKERAAQAEGERKAALERERLAAEDAKHQREMAREKELEEVRMQAEERRFDREKKHVVEVEKVKRGLPESPEADAKAKDDEKVKEETAMSRDQEFKALVGAAIGAVERLEGAIDRMAKSGGARQVSVTELDDNGLPKTLVSRPVTQ